MKQLKTLPIIDLIYPRRCPVCHDIVTPNPDNEQICPACRKRLPYVTEPRCMKCGKQLETEEQEYCEDCIRIPKQYVRGYPVFHYESPVRESVAALKYHNRREYADFYADVLWDQFHKEFLKLDLDGVMPVPLHRRKQRSRGYNQAECLATRLSERLNLPCYTGLLLRTAYTTPQKDLNDKERMNNLKKAFFFRKNEVKLKKILLVDDIYTTGSTIEACTEALHQGGVSDVYYTSICIGKGYI